MMRYLVILSFVFLGCQSKGFIEKKWDIEIHGHRGARAVQPENTIPSFKAALSAGVDTLEMDLVATKDNYLVVSHNLYVSPELCTGPRGQILTARVWIRELTLKEVKMYDCGRLKNPHFPKQQTVPGTPIPTLKEVFQFIKKSGIVGSKEVQFNIETKIIPARPELSPSPEEYVDLLMQVVHEFGLMERVILQSFDHRILKMAKLKFPELKTSALIARNLPNLVLLAQDLKAHYVSPHFEFINKEVVQELHKKGVKVIPWTVNEPEDWGRLLNLGVDGLITDDPQALIFYLNKKKEGSIDL